MLTLVFGHAGGALAAGGGRIGGGSFRAPSRTYSAPRTYAPPGGYGGGMAMATAIRVAVLAFLCISALFGGVEGYSLS